MERSFCKDITYSIIMTVFVLAVLIVAGTRAVHYPEAGTGEYRLPVFETSDIHGNFVGNAGSLSRAISMS